MDALAKLIQGFQRRFKEAPSAIVRAPGRINLIGGHTDYNEGFVLPIAIEQAVWIALRPRDDHQLALYSLDLRRSAHGDLNKLVRRKGWFEYPKGMAWALQEAGYELRGWEGVVAGEIPMGAGLGSSAALEMAVGYAFATISEFEWSPSKMARVGQQAENGWVGLQSGVMDQLASAAGQADHAVLIDCRSLETTPVPLPPQLALVVMDTTTRRGLAESAYNERREQSEA
ncbi:MAG: galactokinase, partial [Chloroflexi bacterium]|nr:galactokinase [Chloroflexota bacterium]